MTIERLQPYLLSLFRFVTGLIFVHYGVAKLFKFPPVEIFEDVGSPSFSVSAASCWPPPAAARSAWMR